MKNRELDGLVAEKIMGYTIEIQEITQWTSSRIKHWIDNKDRAVASQFMDLENAKIEGWRSNGGLPYYSSNMADAWTIVERMCFNEYPYEFELSRGGDYDEMGNSNGRWYCQIGTAKVSEKTAEMAICMAALKSIGEKVELSS